MRRRTRTLPAVLAACAAVAAAAVLPGAARAETVLTGVVGPGFEITLKDASGAAVKTLAPGAYTIKVSDVTSAHNFHFFGPGVVRRPPWRVSRRSPGT